MNHWRGANDQRNASVATVSEKDTIIDIYKKEILDTRITVAGIAKASRNNERLRARKRS